MSKKKVYTWERGSSVVSERDYGSSSVKQKQFDSLPSQVKARFKNGK